MKKYMKVYGPEYYDANKGQFLPSFGSVYVTFEDSVATENDLPLTNNHLYDGRITLDTNHLYVWDSHVWYDQGVYDIGDDVLSGKITPNFNQPLNVKYADASNGDDITGDGSPNRPYKTIAQAVSTSLDYGLVYLYPGDYRETAAINLPDHISIVGMSPLFSNIFCDMNIIPNGAVSTLIMMQNVALQGMLTIDLTNTSFASLNLECSVCNITRLDNRQDCLVAMRGAIFGSLRGKNIIRGGVFFGGGGLLNGLTLQPDSNTIITESIFLGAINIKGNAVVRTTDSSLLNTDKIITGIIESSNTPTWYTDATTDIDYNGDVNKQYINTTNAVKNTSNLPGATVEDALNNLAFLPLYASNDDAITGGLVDGQFYRTGDGFVKVVY